MKNFFNLPTVAKNAAFYLFALVAFFFSANVSAQCSCADVVGTGSGTGLVKLSQTALQTPPQNSCIKVVGDFEIDAGQTWDLELVQIFLEPNSKIIVSSGGKIKAKSTEFGRCWAFAQPWDKIDVKGGGIFESPNSCGNLFWGARTAINLQNNSHFDLDGCRFWWNDIGVKINGNHPTDYLNYCGFQLGNVPGTLSNTVNKGIILNGSNIALEGNEIYGDLQVPYVSESGIEMLNCSNITINGGKIFNLKYDINILPPNSQNINIKNMLLTGDIGVNAVQGLNGLLVENCVLRVEKEGVFVQNHSPANPVNGIVDELKSVRIQNNRISSSSKSGVKIDGLTSNGRIFVRDNPRISIGFLQGGAIYGVEVINGGSGVVAVTGNFISQDSWTGTKPNGGIRVHNRTGKTVIRGNTILPNDINSNGEFKFGIAVTSSKKVQIVGNTINGSNNTMDEGIQVENCPDDILLCCNEITKADKGLKIGGTMSNFDIFGTEFNVHSDAALYYQNISTFNAPQEHRGNDWTNASGNFDAYYNGQNYAVIPAIHYLVDPTFMPNGTAKVSVDGMGNLNQWFDNPSGAESGCSNFSATTYCGETKSDGLVDDPESSTNNITGIDEWAMGNLADPSMSVVYWIAQKDLFQKLSNNPGLLSQSAMVENFYAENQSSNLGKFCQIIRGIERLHNPETSYAVDFYDKIEDLSDLNDQLIMLDAQIASSPTGATNSQTAQLDALLGQISSVQSALSGYYAQIDANAGQTLSNLIELNQSISPVSNFEANEKNINSIELAARSSNDWDFTTAQQQAIDDVAALCPMQAGPAVYQARLLQEYYRMPTWNMDCSPIVDLRSTGEKLVSGKSSAYPNPVSESLTITLGRSFRAGGKLELVDLFGNLAQGAMIKADSNQETVSTANLKSGIYTLRIFESGVIVEQKKICIVHQ